MTPSRVVVTGLGVKAPPGIDVDTFWSALRSGQSVAGPITRFDASLLTVQFACEVPAAFDPVAVFGPKEARRADRVAQLGVAAAEDAIASAGDLDADPARCAVIAGTGVGGLDTLLENFTLYTEKGPDRISPFCVPMLMPNATAGLIGMRHGFTGVNLCVATACASGAQAIGEGLRLFRDGEVDVVVAGGTEAPIMPMAVAAFARMGALSKRNDDPARASRPFDVDRDGFVLAEGAAFVVLEKFERAQARGAPMHGELLGYGRNSDAHHITAPSPGGEGAAACMRLALDDADLSPDAIGHINAHGTSTPLNDVAEAEAIGKVFGDTPPPVTSTKGVTGHCIGATGAIEAVASILAARDGVIPPTANLENLDPDIPLDVVSGSERVIGPAIALSNSFAFGGHNVTLIVGPPPA